MTFLPLIYLMAILTIPLGGCSDGALEGAFKMDRAKIWLEKVNFKINKSNLLLLESILINYMFLSLLAFKFFIY